MTGSRKGTALRWSPASLKSVALTSVAALSTAFMAGPAMAQTLSFNAGTPTVASGSVTFDRGVTTPGVEVYTVNSRTAVLDFTPTDTSNLPGWINFQNAGTTVRYTNGTNTPTFTVLNRIVPTDPSRAIQFNGRVISEIRNGNTTTPGGDVWFYSPGGIVLGATAAFDVGSLLLTTRDPTNGTGIIGSTTSFRGGGNAGAFIDIQRGASINATAEGSYVALMSPLVRQFGNVRVNGSAAYVAAEDAQITINNGLFDIAITTGTDTGQGFPIIHDGSTTGPASTGATDPHRIYMVSMPKSTAITILLTDNSRVGYDTATNAAIENGRVVLSSGFIVEDGEYSDLIYTHTPTDPTVPAPISSVHISGQVTSNLFARATQDVFAASLTGTPTFSGDVTLWGGLRAHIGARRAGETLTVGGNLNVTTDWGYSSIRRSGSQWVTDSFGGESLIYADNGGILQVNGTARVSATASQLGPTDYTSAPLLSSATGGRAHIFANTNGSIRIAGNTTVDASAYAGSPNSPLYGAVDLTGGQALINTAGGGTITLGGATNFVSAGATNASPASRGTNRAGSASIATNAGGGAIQIAGNMSLSALASDLGTRGGGASTGGSATVFAAGGPITFGGNLSLSAYAMGGGDDEGNAGTGTAGLASITANTGSTITVSGQTSLDVFARGGTATGTAAGSGGRGVGGTAYILSNGTINLNGEVYLTASATGGNNARSGVFGGSGGEGFAGSAYVRGGTGSIVIGNDLLISSVGTGGSSTGSGGDGGNGIGGGARVDTLQATGRVSVAGVTSVTASGNGGNGLGGTSRGGDGLGGSSGQASNFQRGAFIFSAAGNVDLAGQATVSAIGRGGNGGIGGNGTGGLGNIYVYDGSVSIGGTSFGNVGGYGGAANQSNPGQTGGAGGSGLGGQFLIGSVAITGGGSVRLGPTTFIDANGVGGVGAAGVNGAGGQGGTGTGGLAQAYASASAGGLTAGAITMSAGASGGAGGAGSAGFTGGAGGAAVGGQSTVGTNSGNNLPANTGFATFGATELSATGIGGAGGAGGGTAAAGLGGSGTGGRALVLVRGTPVTIGTLRMTANGIGGTGSVGGLGLGGVTTLVASNRFERTERGRLTTDAVTMTAIGAGGAGSTAGQSVAGAGEIEVSGADVNLASLTFTSQGPLVHPVGYGFIINVAHGTVVLNRASITTPNEVSINPLQGGILRLPSLAITAGGMSLGNNPDGSIGPGLVEFGDLSITTTGDILADQALRVSGSLTISTTGIFDLQARLSGRTIAITSAGIVIGANGGLGDAQTQSIVLTGLGAMQVGGTIGTPPSGLAAEGQNWWLTSAEASRLRANRIEFRAASGQLLTIGNLTMTGSAAGANANLTGENASVSFVGDRIRVEGALSLTGAGATDTVRLTGGQSVAVVTDRNGSISITGPATEGDAPLAGTLLLEGPVIGVGTSALLTQLLADPRFAGRNALLATAPTTPRPEGYVSANRLILSTTNVAAIQNSGTPSSFGGFTTGVGGLEIRTPNETQTGTTSPQVIAYGRVQRAGGTFSAGTDLGTSVDYATGQQRLFDRSSSVNGCAIGASCGSEPATITATVSAIEEVMASSQAAVVEVPAIRVVQIVDQQELRVDPVITAPVSGAGNTSLWDTGDTGPSNASGGQTR